MSTEVANEGVMEPVPTPANIAENKDVANSEKPSEQVNGKAPVPEAVVAELDPRPGATSEDAELKLKRADEGKVPIGPNSAGDKHERDENAAPAAIDGEGDAKLTPDGAAEAAKEPTAKKQKVGEGQDAPKKRGPGRPKKGDGTGPGPAPKKKQPTPRSTEGIGSRTRSRAN